MAAGVAKDCPQTVFCERTIQSPVLAAANVNDRFVIMRRELVGLTGKLNSAIFASPRQSKVGRQLNLLVHLQANLCQLFGELIYRLKNRLIFRAFSIAVYGQFAAHHASRAHDKDCRARHTIRHVPRRILGVTNAKRIDGF